MLIHPVLSNIVISWFSKTGQYWNLELAVWICLESWRICTNINENCYCFFSLQLCEFSWILSSVSFCRKFRHISGSFYIINLSWHGKLDLIYNMFLGMIKFVPLYVSNLWRSAVSGEWGRIIIVALSFLFAFVINCSMISHAMILDILP